MQHKLIITSLAVIIPAFVFTQGTGTAGFENFWNSNLFSSLVGGLIGGILGVIGTLWTSYYGPKKLIEFKDNREEQKLNAPRKKLLLKLLKDSDYPDGRTIKTLSMVTGTTPEECRRLLVEINARGIKLKGDQEGWVLIEKKPIKDE